MSIKKIPVPKRRVRAATGLLGRMRASLPSQPAEARLDAMMRTDYANKTARGNATVLAKRHLTPADPNSTSTAQPELNSNFETWSNAAPPSSEPE